MNQREWSLQDWLAHCERLHPKEIDLTLDRVRRVHDRLHLRIEAPVITVAGTNGKGSTCAMLEAVAQHAGYRVGLYIKPHLVHFEERCRVDSSPVSADRLLPHFERVEQVRHDEVLTYFEFTTLAILSLLADERLDLLILEVGLGGRLDAVNVVEPSCAVITSIDLDHMEFLGPDREAIGGEKAHIMRSGKPAIVSDPVAPASVTAHAAHIGADLWLFGRDFNYSGDRQQWSWTGRGRRLAGLAYPALRGANQLLNASGALAALQALRDRLPVPVQAIRQGLAAVELPGRFQIVPGEPVLVLDVAHNPHSVAALALNLDEMGFYPRSHAVFGAMHDKDLAGVMRRMSPLVDSWHFSDLPTPRAASASDLATMWAGLVAGGQGRADATVEQHPGPAEALRAAVVAADPADRIIVFGSFYTVGGVLKDGLPRLSARHLG
jgi:dihydrofolate synthase / folylpolyglutamate synthase